MKYAHLPPDKQVGNYSWNHQAHLGSGAYGKVYLGFNQKTKEKVAIKVMENAQISDPYLQQALKNEVSILSTVKGPYVVGLLDYMQTKNRTYIIQMFCNMGDFRSYLTKKGKIPEAEAKVNFGYKKILSDLLQGMQELSRHNLVHRDLKPENILIHDNVFKVADFGFGKNVGDMNAMLKTCCGTPLYMSPQILTQQKYTPKSDVWSMGMIYYEMLFGKTPWPCRSQAELVNNVQTMPIKFPYGDQISEESKHFIRKCLAVQEKDRYSWDQVFSDQIFTKQSHELKIQKRGSVNENDKNLLKYIQDSISKKNLNVHELFIQTDKNRTGSLDQQEMMRFVQMIDPQINPQHVGQLFAKLDVNNDNQISFEEFQELFLHTDYSNQGNQMLDEYRANKILKKVIDLINDNQIDISRIFRKFDTSGDNQLDINEFGKILQVIDSSIIEQEIRFIFKKFDKDSSGAISLQEFKKEVTPKMQQQPTTYEPSAALKNLHPESQYTLNSLKSIIAAHQLDLQQIFFNFDRDRSGTLDYQEFVKLLYTINQRIPESAIQQLFNFFDQNHSGSILFEEFAKMLK